MSRLDDELKAAFGRQEPSPDFAARVLARINDAPAPQPRPRLWQRLGGVFAVPAWRYAAVGAAALLLIFISIALLRSQRAANKVGEPSPLAVAAGDAAGAQANADDQAARERAASEAASNAPDRGTQATPTGARTGAATTSPRAVKSHQQVRRHAPVIAGSARPSAEAEAAKEKVLFALQITSETLGDVQRAIADDSPSDERPEPVQNR
jgi:negative regulator of sigma E activity